MRRTLVPKQTGYRLIGITIIRIVGVSAQLFSITDLVLLVLQLLRGDIQEVIDSIEPVEP